MKTKLLNAQIKLINKTARPTGRSRGKVMYQSFCLSVVPSIIAASYRSTGIACNAERKAKVVNGKDVHKRATRAPPKAVDAPVNH